MKKFTAIFILVAMMAVILPFAAISANAQRRRIYKKPNVYQRHRNLFNIGIGTAAGAILGGLIGGRKGALIGAGAGAGGSALYTYKLKPKRR
jgi:hypothetical protein